MKVLVLTTSYPRTADDTAGLFVRDAVERLRERGVEVVVVSPADFEHHGIAYGAGIAGNLRGRPALAIRLPSMMRNFRRAAERAARDVDLVHAHWLPVGVDRGRAGEARRRAGVGNGRRARPPRAVARAPRLPAGCGASSRRRRSSRGRWNGSAPAMFG